MSRFLVQNNDPSDHFGSVWTVIVHTLCSDPPSKRVDHSLGFFVEVGLMNLFQVGSHLEVISFRLPTRGTVRSGRKIESMSSVKLFRQDIRSSKVGTRKLLRRLRLC